MIADEIYMETYRGENAKHRVSTTIPKTSSVILEILKILIQNQVIADKIYMETCRGKDAKHRVSTTKTSSLLLDNPYLIFETNQFVNFSPCSG